MAHLLQAIAQHWHLSISHYWHLRLLCAIALGPLLGILCLLLSRGRNTSGPGMLRVKRSIQLVALRSARPLPL